MHDPMTVAFEIRYPWLAYPKAKRTTDFTRSYRRSFITIWHVDPERSYPGSGSDDDSCDWFGSYRPLDEREHAIIEALWDLEGIVGNEPFYGSEHFMVEFPTDEDGRMTGERVVHGRLGRAYTKLQETVRLWRRRDRHWWQHPRWHVWHWQVQIHPLQHFKRWAFSRCSKCGGRFAWGYAPVTNSWYGTGPRWFRNEGNDVWHSNCDSPANENAVSREGGEGG